MNKKLTEQIINQVFSNLLIINSNEFNQKKYRSIVSDEFLLDMKISFQDESGIEIKNNIWGVQLVIEEQPLKMLLANCSIEPNILEYSLIVSLKDTPAYGLYSAYSVNNDSTEQHALIALSADRQNWIKCNTYLQATFLAGMENLKDIPFSMSKVTNYSEEHNLLLSFINYHNFIFGEPDEGQENKL
jgi:hypothetical protein